MIKLENEKAAVNYVQNSPDGSVVVITDVPAHVYEEDGVEDTVYDMDVALKLEDFVTAQFEGNVDSKRRVMLAYNDIDFGSNSDAEFRIQGREVNYGEATTKIWKESIDKIHGSIDVLRKAYTGIFPSPRFSFPVVTSVGQGSLKFALRAREPLALFEDYRDDSSTEIKVLQLLFDGYAYVNSDNVSSQLIQDYEEIAFATLEAIEKLSPSEGSTIQQIQITPNEQVIKGSPPVTLTVETHHRAKWKREALQARLDDIEVRQIVIVGQVFWLERGGELLIKEIEYNYPSVKKYNTSATFNSQMFKDIAALFAAEKRITFRGVERKIKGKWSNPEITSVEEAPPKDGDVSPHV